jgi:hypothetical protein
MKMILIALSLLGSIAQADFKLANNGKKVVCYADDNQSWELNRARTKLKYTVEGESLGAFRIFDRRSDRRTFVSYSSDEGTLTLGKRRDTFQFAEADDAFEVSCQ